MSDTYDDVKPEIGRLRVLADRHRAKPLLDALDLLVAEVSALRERLSRRDYPGRDELTVICTVCGEELPIVTILGDSGHTTLGVQAGHCEEYDHSRAKEDARNAWGSS